ncbi:MAG TPA: phosphoribosyltransferase family protein [Nitriliruptorales bacterium]|nr:phosphoribosyltransferase family protein [Nitriliruptorales bacterium]
MIHGTEADEAPATELAGLRQTLRDLVRERGHRTLPEPIQLASGAFSRDFIDVKQALARGADLRLACRALLAIAREEAVAFDAVGGLTLGADALAHGTAILSRSAWFVVRKERKGRGTDKLIEGAVLGHGHRVLLVDDVVTTGGSIQAAYRSIRETGAHVVLASALVDRGDTASAFFAAAGVPYRPVLTYRDVGIEPIGPPPGGTTSGRG